MLSQYIYFMYYFVNNRPKFVIKPELSRNLAARYVVNTERHKFSNHPIDFYNKQSRSISSWTSSSVASSSTTSSSGIFNVNQFNDHHKSSLDCSTCDTSLNYRYKLDTIDCLTAGRRNKLNYDDDTSSGVATSDSTTSDSSLSSIYNDLSYYCQHESAFRWQQSTNPKTKIKKSQKETTLSSNILAGDLTGNFYDKVLVWIKNSGTASPDLIPDLASCPQRHQTNEKIML